MTPFEIRKGLRRLDFAPTQSAAAHSSGTHVTVEFEVGTRLADGQLASINLGLRDGIARELKGAPVLVSPPRAKQTTYLYRLEGDVA